MRAKRRSKFTDVVPYSAPLGAPPDFILLDRDFCKASRPPLRVRLIIREEDGRSWNPMSKCQRWARG
ncbi:hypothetical protein VDGE_30063 [Verticillium dahliae]|uniref:Uncharacterized protein n=1 Tax=Verticillium dahliae TaxID=27337 RepID=A0A444RLR8_VERDA|nr:hypothetical protein VDGE_30063 [Verticillium dahliae]